MTELLKLNIDVHHIISTPLCLVRFIGGNISWSCSIMSLKLTSPWCHYSIIDDYVHFNCAKFTHTYSYQYR